MAGADFETSCKADPLFQMKSNGHGARKLTQEEQNKLSKDTKLVSDFKQQKLEQEAKKNWDLFYKRNTTKFFKDRHWTTREFNELCGTKEDGTNRRILEVGCGVGNFLFPLIQENSNLFFYACDFSPRAIQFVKDNPLYTEKRCKAFVCDLTQDPLCANIPDCHVDVVTMIFVLSAIHPEKMLQAIKNIYTVVQPGGCILFRDYGKYDHAQLRFAPGHKLSENFYVRQDGTMAYYFTPEMLADLFKQAGCTIISNEYILRQTINKKEGIDVPRVFVQSRFGKPLTSGKISEEATPLDGASSQLNILRDTAIDCTSCIANEQAVEHHVQVVTETFQSLSQDNLGNPSCHATCDEFKS